MAASRSRAACVFLALALLAPRAYGAESVVSEWFRTDPKARAYAGVQQEIADVFDRAARNSIPLELLMDKLREGASKKVPGERLVSGIEAEAGRLQIAQGVLARLDIALVGAPQAEVLKAASLGLLAGLSTETIEGLFAFTKQGGRDVREAGAACDVLTQLRLAGSLENERLSRLGVSLLKSRLTAAAFRSVPAFYVRAIARGLGDEAVVERIIIPTLAAGGGLVQMESALDQVTRGRSR